MPTTYVWRPSSARRVVLDGFTPVPRGTPAMSLPTLAWPAKDPADVLDYEIDFAAAVAGDESDGLRNVIASVTPDAVGDLVVNSVAVDGAVVVLWLAGGQPGTVYSVGVHVTTQSGRSIGRAVSLPVLGMGSAVGLAGALTTELGTVITDQSGNPILTGS